MIILGIAAEHNSSACLMIDGKIKGLVQEERFTKLKNQCAFPLLSINSLVNNFLDGDASRIDHVVYGSILSDPYYSCINKFSNIEMSDVIEEMNEMWFPIFYEGKKYDGSYWRKMFINGKNLNKNHNYDFSFLKKKLTIDQVVKYFCEVERTNVVKKYINNMTPTRIDHHTCHAYYAAYGGILTSSQLKDTIIITADAWGDGKNWSVSMVKDNGVVSEIASGTENIIARVYKFCTIILGMKPNEHEYKVMGLSGYSISKKHIKFVEDIFYEILDFSEGNFISKKPLKDSYFDLKQRLEGHRFDNIAAALQNWSSKVTVRWATYWLKKNNKKGIAFSGGLSMNIKANGDLLSEEGVEWLSVPASGGDESLSAGACYALALQKQTKVTSMVDPYLGDNSVLESNNWSSRLNETSSSSSDFDMVEDFDVSKVAKLLAKDEVIARCVGKAEFGARALGNRSILANPGNFDNIKKINDLIKNRDFWMPFTPSILEEYANKYLLNPKDSNSPYMTIGFKSTMEARKDIKACLHMGDYSARPQLVKKEINEEYWKIIYEFYKITDVPCILNTSLNLHGEPMNYTLADSVRTLALSSLNFLLIPNDKLLYKKEAYKILKNL